MHYALFMPVITEKDINQKLKQINAILEIHKSQAKNIFLETLKKRMQEFEVMLEDLPSDKEAILEQYYKFTKTLLLCLEKPLNSSFYINHYLNSLYHPVGILDFEPANPTLCIMAICGIILGTILLASSIPAFIFNPSVGAFAIALAMTFLLPSAYYLMLPHSLDINKKKQQEKELFLEAVLLTTEADVHENTDYPYETIQLACIPH